MPRQALVNNDTVRVIDSEGQLITKQVEIAQVELDNVIITEGLAGGDIVCLTDVPFFVEGMRLDLRLLENEREDDSLEGVTKIIEWCARHKVAANLLLGLDECQ